MKKLGIVLLVMIVAVAAFIVFQRSRPKEVMYSSVQQLDYYEKILTTGTVQLAGLTEIKTEISGKIVDVLVNEGDAINQGEVLLKFDTTEVNLDLQQAEASYALAKSRFDEIVNTTCPTSREQYQQAKIAEEELQEEVVKYQRLYEQKAISKDQLDKARHQLELQQSTTEIQKQLMESCAQGGAKRETAQAEMKSAQSRIDLLNNRMQKHLIRSPITGIIIQEFKSTGEYARIGENLFMIAKEDGKYIEIELDERNLPRIDVGQTVLISTEFYPDNKIKGEISYIAPSVDPNKGTVKLKVNIIEDTDYLIKYLTVRCEIISETYPDALVIPQEYIVQEDNRFYIFAFTEGKAVKKQISIDNPNAREVRIRDGVKLEDIILDPMGLEDGMDVVLKQ